MDDAPFVHVLGVPRLVVGGRRVPVPTGKPSVLLALLALHAGTVVAIPAVIDAVWDEDPPSSARALVHTYVSALRRALQSAGPGSPRLETVTGGYRLALEPEAVDVRRLLAVSADATADQLEVVLRDYAEPLLPGVEGAWAEGWRARVAAARASAQDLLWRRRIEQGEARAVLEELRAGVREEPLWEDRVLLLARALADCGRREDGLSALEAYRLRLSAELGLDPSPQVASLRQALLGAPPDVAAGPSVAGASGAGLPAVAPRRRRGVAVAAGAAAALAATLVAVWVFGGGAAPPVTISGPSLVVVDPDSFEIVDTRALPVEPTEVDVEGSVGWVISEADRAVASVDLGTDATARVFGLPEGPTALAVVDGTATVALGFSGEVVRVTGAEVGPPSPLVPDTAGKLILATDPDGIWVATIDGVLLPPDAARPAADDVVLASPPRRMAVAGGRAWVLTFGSTTLVRADPATGRTRVSALRGEPVDVAAAGEIAWAVTNVDDRLWQTSPEGRVVATKALPGAPTGVLVRDGLVWVAIGSPSSLIVIDPKDLSVVNTVDLSREPADLADSASGVVVAVR